MIEFLAEIAARAGWAIPVAIVAWLLGRRLTRIPGPGDAAPDQPRDGLRRRVLVLLGVAALLWLGLVGVGTLITGVLEPIRTLDASIIDWFAEHRGDAATSAAILVDHVGDTPGIVAVLLIAAATAHAVTRRWRPALVLVVAAVGETTIFLLAQSVISRARPDVEHLAVEPATSSYPSGHVAATAATYGCIALLMLAWTRGALRLVAVAAAIVLPLAVAWARMYQGMHYPSDVLTSLIFGVIWLGACWWTFRATPPGEPATVTHTHDASAGVTMPEEVRP